MRRSSLGGVLARSALSVGCLYLASIPGHSQTMPPDFPKLPPGFKMPAAKPPKGSKTNNSTKPAGTPMPPDAPPAKAFQLLAQQSVYHMRMTVSNNDPMMEQALAMMGMTPFEVTAAGPAKLVSMHMQIPFLATGQVDDWEFLAVSLNGRAARKMVSDAIPRLLALDDANFAKQMAEANRAAARSIATSLASGPAGWLSAGVQAAATAASEIAAANTLRQVHEFFNWQCVNTPDVKPVDRTVLPPMSNLKALPDQTIQGAKMKSYEFYISEQGQAFGPLRMHVAKDSGLPARIEMVFGPAGGLQIDYFDFNKGGDFEIPPCLAAGKK